VFIINAVNRNKAALILGIDHYYNNGLEQLPSCKKDAEDLYKILTTHRLDYTIFKGHHIIGSKLKKSTEQPTSVHI
jgi:Caspase domain